MIALRQGQGNAVKNDKLELRWGVEQRLEFIEFRLFWEGRVKPITNAAVMRVTAIQTKLNESGRTGLPAALKNVAAGQGQCGFAANPTKFKLFGERKRRLKGKSIDLSGKSGSFSVNWQDTLRKSS